MVQDSNYKKDNSTRATSHSSGLAGLLSPRLFKALADPKRLSLLVRLAEGRGPCTVSHVAQGSNVDLSVVSRHLAILREAGIIKCVKRGKEVWCTVEKTAVVQILRDLADALEACCREGSCQDASGSALSVKPPRPTRPPRHKPSQLP